MHPRSIIGKGYLRSIIQSLRHAQRRDLVHDPDDLCPDIDDMIDNAEVDDIPF